jgi:hypothetical protein
MGCGLATYEIVVQPVRRWQSWHHQRTYDVGDVVQQVVQLVRIVKFGSQVDRIESSFIIRSGSDRTIFLAGKGSFRPLASTRVITVFR